jgi:ABC-2 type transport system permease protein
MKESFNRIWRLIIKEFIQVLRDPRARFSLIAPPIVQMLIFGYAASFEVRHVTTAMLDLDHSQESRELISRFWASDYFDITRDLDNRREIAGLMDRRKIALAIHIMPGFAENLRKGQTANVQVILDGTDSNTALVALGYIGSVTQRFSRQYMEDRLMRTMPQIGRIPSVNLVERPWFNPDLDSTWFFVPGTIGALTLTLVMVMTAFAIVREREIGTLEQIMVTPVSPAELIAGKTVPYMMIALVQLTIVALLAVFWFRVPFQGSVMVLMLGSVLFIFSVLAIGLLISTVSATQQQAMVTAFFFIMPAITLSGFSFPISSMPVFLQWATYIDPLRYYEVVLRDCFLKGNGMAVLWPQMVAMAILGGVLITFASIRFHKTLD